jgi:hypothetical protein
MAGPWCSEPDPAVSRLVAGRTVRLRLYLGAGVSPEQLRREIDSLRGYFARYDLSFTGAPAAPSIIRIELGPVMAGTASEVHEALARAGILANSAGDDRVREVTARVVAAALADFLSLHAQPEPDTVDIVLLERVMTPDSPLAQYVERLAGLTVAPKRRREPTIRSAGEPDGGSGDDLASQTLDQFVAALGLDQYTPTIFLSHHDLGGLHPKRRATTLAHEMGHVFGLAHSRNRDDLMALDRRTDCVPTLGPEHVAGL